MANEILLPGQPTGLNLFTLLFDAASNAWNAGTVAFEAWNDLNLASYTLSTAYLGTSGFVAASMPAGVTSPGVYTACVFKRAGGSPSLSDTVSGYVGGAQIDWDGSKASRISVGPLDTSLAGHVTLGSVGRALQIARAQGRGNWTIDSTHNTLTIYDLDGTTPIVVFNLAPVGGPYGTRTATTTE